MKENAPGADARVWQRNYYERVIRSDAEPNRSREYVATNPLRWRFVHENPHRTPDLGHDRDWAWIEEHTPDDAP